MLDWRGSRIVPGSKVVYPGRRGSSTWLNEGYVLDLSTAGIRVRRMGDTLNGSTGRVVTLTNFLHVTVIND